MAPGSRKASPYPMWTNMDAPSLQAHHHFIQSRPASIRPELPSPIARLPNEILLIIANQMEVKGIAALVKVNRHFYHLFNPVLYSMDARFGNSSALVFAVSKKIISTARFAISRGADPNSRQGDILWSAFENQDVEMARLLLEAGADPNGRTRRPIDDHRATNPTHLMRMFKPVSTLMYEDYPNYTWHMRSLWNEDTKWEAYRIEDFIPVLGVLLEFNPDVNCADSNGCTALHFAANFDCHELVRLLINRGADIDAQDFKGYTPLCRAAMNNFVETAEVLLKHHAKTDNQIGQEGETSLSLAIRFADQPDNTMSKLLIEYGADPQAPGSDGDFPLHGVAFTNNWEIALGLIEKGANVNVLDSRQETPLQKAATMRNLHIVDILLRNDPDPVCRDVFNQITPHDYDKGQALNILANKGVDGTRLAAEAPLEWRGRKGS